MINGLDTDGPCECNESDGGCNNADCFCHTGVCQRCNGNGCPVCEKLKFNIKE